MTHLRCAECHTQNIVIAFCDEHYHQSKENPISPYDEFPPQEDSVMRKPIDHEEEEFEKDLGEVK